MGEAERARAIFELAIAQPALDMPEVWMDICIIYCIICMYIVLCVLCVFCVV